MRSYRVLKITRNDFSTEPQPTTQIVWEGTDLAALSKQFPKSNVMGADELGFHSIEDGWISWHYRFEECSECVEWHEINDPRHKIHDRRQAALEAAIDEENRRLFPGDYLDEDDHEDYAEEEDC